MKKWISLFTVLAMVFTMTALTACSGGSEGGKSLNDFVGVYVCDRADISIEATGENEASIIVTWAGSAWEQAEWVMSGKFDDEALLIEYHDCVKNVTTYDDDGEVKEVEEVFNGGHGFFNFQEGDPLTLTWQEDQEHIADDMTFTWTDPAELGGGEAGMANPWSDVNSAEEAAEGAGVDGFSAAEGVTISLGEVKDVHYRCMKGIAEAVIEFPAVEMTIRKGDATYEIAEGDISGDYNEYKYDWTQSVKGLEVNCFGNRKGDATKTIWAVDDYDYSICVQGLGGDEDYGLSADDLNSLINAIQ